MAALTDATYQRRCYLFLTLRMVESLGILYVSLPIILCGLSFNRGKAQMNPEC